MKVVVSLKYDVDGATQILTQCHIPPTTPSDILAKLLAELEVMRISLLQQYEAQATKEADVVWDDTPNDT